MRTARWSTSSTRRPAACASPTTPGSAAGAAGSGSARSTCPSASGMFGQAVAERAVVTDRRLPRRPGVRARARTRTASCATSASARWSARRSSPGTTVFGAMGTFSVPRRRIQPAQPSPSSAPSPTMPRRRWPTSGSSRTSTRRDASWPIAPTSSGPCARSRPGSAPPRTSRRSSSWASTRRSGSSTRDGARIDLIEPVQRAPALGLRLRGGPPGRRRVAGRPGRDPRPGGLRPGGRHRAGVLDRRLHQRHAVRARPRRRQLRGRVGRPLGHGRAADRRERSVRQPDDLHQPARRLGREPTPTSSRRSRTRPPSRSGRPGCSTSSTGRARRWPAVPRRSRRCARSPPGSRSCASRPRSSRTSSPRPAAWSGRTA